MTQFPFSWTFVAHTSECRGKVLVCSSSVVPSAWSYVSAHLLQWPCGVCCVCVRCMYKNCEHGKDPQSSFENGQKWFCFHFWAFFEKLTEEKLCRQEIWSSNDILRSREFVLTGQKNLLQTHCCQEISFFCNHLLSENGKTGSLQPEKELNVKYS